MLRTLGADEVLDYTREDFTEHGVRYDLVVDIPGNRPFSAIKRALEPDGRYLPIGHEHYGGVGKRVFGLLPHFFKLMFLARVAKQLGGARAPPPTKQGAMATLRDLLDAGKITPLIDSSYPLRKVREAFRHLIEDELQGKVIVTPRGSNPPAALHPPQGESRPPPTPGSPACVRCPSGSLLALRSPQHPMAGDGHRH